MRKHFANALGCVGAVIGAGFASGREIIVFFSRYNHHAWWLILLAACVMTGLCVLRMNAVSCFEQKNGWLEMISRNVIARAIMICIMLITTGAMIAAAGHMTALVCQWHGAYAIGVLGTLLTAWALGFRDLKALNGCSALLTAVLLMALGAAYALPESRNILINHETDIRQLVRAAIRVVGYAAMNISLASGVVWSSAQKKGSWKIAAVFGCMMAALMGLSSGLYGLHAELTNEAFPFVRLMAAYGRKGYLLSVLVLYLSILTTLISLVYSLRTAVEAWTDSRGMRILLVFALPMAISRLGFAQIVDRFYASAGLICLAAVDIPLFCRMRKRQVCS